MTITHDHNHDTTTSTARPQPPTSTKPTAGHPARPGRLVGLGLDQTRSSWGSSVSGHDRSSKPGPGRRRPVHGPLPADRPDRLDSPTRSSWATRRSMASPPVPARTMTETLTLPGRLPNGVTLEQRRLRPDRGHRRSGELRQRVALDQQRVDLGSVHRAAARQCDHRADRPAGRDAPLGGTPRRPEPGRRTSSGPSRDRAPGSRNAAKKKLKRKVGSPGINASSTRPRAWARNSPSFPPGFRRAQEVGLIAPAGRAVASRRNRGLGLIHGVSAARIGLSGSHLDPDHRRLVHVQPA